MKLLTTKDIKLVAEKLNILPEVLFAIDRVESAGCGFYLDEGIHQFELKCLMEGHYFSKFTNKFKVYILKMSNILQAIKSIVDNPIIQVKDYYTGRNRANSIGDALEKVVFAKYINEKYGI